MPGRSAEGIGSRCRAVIRAGRQSKIREGALVAGATWPGEPAVRDVTRLEVARVGAVERGEDVSLPYRVLDAHGREVAEVSEFMRHLTASDVSPASVRSYARALLRWLRFLWAVGVAWDRAGQIEVRDFVLWLRSARKAAPTRRPGGPTPGSVNPKTGKRYLATGFAPATINHNLTVVSAFYAHAIDRDHGPVRNPVPARAGPDGGRVAAHHNPLEPFPRQRRADLRQRAAATAPRAIPDSLFDELFAAMGSDRDRALLALYVSTGARASELLGVTGAQVDYGEQLVAVVRKGTRALQWLPAAPDAFVWLRRYQQTLPAACLGADRPVWWTLRRPYRPLTYDAARAVLRRANQALGTNWTLHDLRHTCAVRLANDPSMPLTDVQTLLGHAWLTTTQRYLTPLAEEVWAHARQHHQRHQQPPAPAASAAEATLGYDDGDLRELFGRRAHP
jgi:site-specific recombinase XerD